ncbi:uncharacterized protein CEXT_311171 [Caerostris extrusa]|uniref:Uncharacterized protein n=1 Tax=Caerostris extrusa TaxID=172846 RepID=A0AAV4SPC2_CAEEX|nr:uncharacterized protein CEXT_311171 [Caerostris extrusa]
MGRNSNLKQHITRTISESRGSVSVRDIPTDAAPRRTRAIFAAISQTSARTTRRSIYKYCNGGFFFSSYIYYCVQKYPKEEAFVTEEDITEGYLKEFGHLCNETLVYCQRISNQLNWLIPCSTNSTLHMTVSDGHTGYRNCYTLFSSISSNALRQHTLLVPKNAVPLRVRHAVGGVLPAGPGGRGHRLHPLAQQPRQPLLRRVRHQAGKPLHGASQNGEYPSFPYLP